LRSNDIGLKNDELDLYNEVRWLWIWNGFHFNDGQRGIPFKV